MRIWIPLNRVNLSLLLLSMMLSLNCYLYSIDCIRMKLKIRSIHILHSLFAYLLSFPIWIELFVFYSYFFCLKFACRTDDEKWRWYQTTNTTITSLQLCANKYAFQSTMVQQQQHPMFVVISCGCCFLQSCIAFGVLLPILYSRKCSVTFLKMQFCTATSTAMAIFTLGFLKFLPQVSKYSYSFPSLFI